MLHVLAVRAANRLALAGLGWLAAALLATPARAAPLDVRVLLDVSTSMDATDPDNTRLPAVRLLISMLPEDATAGIWTFGRYVNVQVPPQAVTAEWRARALEDVGRIRNRAPYTNIESALERATADWVAPGPKRAPARELIVLTDGAVSVPGGEVESADSRRRILEQELPRLQTAGARIHTLALTEDADEMLLRRLSTATGGHFEKLSDGSTLPESLLGLLTQITRANTLPVADGRFEVDADVQGVTIVVLHPAPAATATRLRAPGGKPFGALDLPPGVRWRRGRVFDLVALARPLPGEWHMEAGPGARGWVLVSSQLRLETTDLPPIVVPGEKVQVSARLTPRGLRVHRIEGRGPPRFRILVTPEGASAPLTVELSDHADAGEAGAGDATYSALVPIPRRAGPLDVRVRLEAHDLARERRQRVRVEWPVTATIETPRSARGRPDPRRGRLALRLDPTLVDLASLSIACRLEEPGGQVSVLAATGTGARRSALLPPATQAGARRVLVSVEGSTALGHPFALELPPVIAPGLPAPAPPPQTADSASPSPSPHRPSARQAPPEPPVARPHRGRIEPAAAPPDDVAPGAGETIHYAFTAAVVGAVNLAGAGLALGAWLWYRRRAASELNRWLETV